MILANTLTKPKGQPAVDARTPITMWELLVWAYKRQMVHYEYEGRDLEWETGFRSTSATWRLGAALGGSRPARGSINCAGTTAHPDAHLVHAQVMQLDPADAELILWTAERGTSPDPNPVLPPPRVVPVRKGGTGSIRMIYGKPGRPIACMIDYEGVPEDEAAAIRQAARERFARWRQIVLRLHNEMLSQSFCTRWRVIAPGIN